MAHWQQARFWTLTFRKAAESTLTVSAKEPCDQLRVGIAPATLTMSTRASVPSSWAQKLSAVCTCSRWMRSMSARKARASPTVTAPVPRTAIALTFLTPMRAPAPPRPALWYWSVERHAQGSRCSPAGPLDMTFAFGSRSARSAASTSETRMPRYFPAGRSSTTSSLIQTTVGSAARPVTMSAS